MDEFEQSDLKRDTNDSHNTCYQKVILYIEKENAFMRDCIYALFSLVFVIKLGESITEIFSVGLS